MKRSNPTPETIRKAREWAGLTQEQAAALIGYSRRSWQSWEGGQRTMRAVTLAAFKAEVEKR